MYTHAQPLSHTHALTHKTINIINYHWESKLALATYAENILIFMWKFIMIIFPFFFSIPSFLENGRGGGGKVEKAHNEMEKEKLIYAK